MHLDPTDEETAALTQELHDIIENDPLPVLASYPHAKGDPRQAQTRAGSRALAAPEGLRAAVERPIQAARLGG
jgi:hypothetical protein